MTTELTGLNGRNPLGFLAALGVLDVLDRAHPAGRPTLDWSAGLRPVGLIGWTAAEEAPDLDAVIRTVIADQAHWKKSALLNVDNEDIKPDPDTLRDWFEKVAGSKSEADSSLLQALLAEGAVAGSGSEAKPSHLHFTAGQQRFLRMVRELRDQVDEDHFREALAGPWTYRSPLPSLGWDAKGQRIYAVSGFDPAKEKRLTVPGADWLAFLGLRFFPVVNDEGTLLTTGCDRGWKKGAFRWPLWEGALTASTVASLIGSGQLAARGGQAMTDDQLGAWGVREIMTAPIRRTDQGGYGSFGPPTSSATGAGTPTSSLLRGSTRRRGRAVTADASHS